MPECHKDTIERVCVSQGHNRESVNVTRTQDGACGESHEDPIELEGESLGPERERVCKCH